MSQLKKHYPKVITALIILTILFTAVLTGWKKDTAESSEIYTLTYMVDGEVFDQQEYSEGEEITALEAPEKENFMFVEWKNITETMPAKDLTVTAVYEFDGTLVTDMENVYECEIAMGEEMTMMLYLRIDGEGNFVFSRNTDFSSLEKGAGRVYKKANGEYCLVYYMVNGETVAEGEYLSTFDIGDDGRVIFTSLIWFGSTKPQFTAEDGTVTYPEFVISDEEIIKDIDKDAISSIADDESENNSSNSEKDDNSEDAESESSSAFKTGTYGGTYTTEAMGSNLTYYYTMTFNANNTYSYSVKFNVMGSNYNEIESGTYKISGNTITLTNSDGTIMSGKINSNGTISVTRYISSFAFSDTTITLTYNYTPSAGGSSSGSNSGNSSGSSSGDNTGSKPGDSSGSGSGSVIPEVEGTELVSGKYSVDISWSSMAGMFDPVLEINTKNMTFKVYGANAPEASKGKGTVSYKDGVYTLKYSDGEKTTAFTYKDGVITFTSPLHYGNARFNNVDDKGNFVTFKATLFEMNGSEEKPNTGNNSEDGDSEGSDGETSDSESNSSFKTGTYGGTYTTTAMGSELTYTYTMTFNEDNTYSYSVEFKVMGSEYKETEEGTYKVSESMITLKNSQGKAMSGKINSDGTVSLTRSISSFASSEVTITLTHNYKPSTGGSNSGDNSGSNPGDNSGSGSEGETPDVEGTELVSGKYSVDISWSAMAGMFDPVLEIDAENMTFNVYGANAPETSKGNGTVSYEDGVYTLNYSDGEKTTTFTYADGVISFTSALHYGNARFNNVDDDGNFVPFTAMLEDAVTFETGTYVGTYSTIAMGSELLYTYSVTFNADNTYTYVVDFNFYGTDYQQIENGSYAVDGTTLKLTPVASVNKNEISIEGTITGEGTATINKYVSRFASSPAVITLTLNK